MSPSQDWHGGLSDSAEDTLARLLADTFALRKVTTVLDVGAHEGGYHDFLRSSVGYEGRIVSFEPQADVGARLASRSTREPNWDVRGVAIGATIERRRLSLFAGSTLASLHQLNDDGRALLRGAPMRGDEEVQLTTLDACWEELELDGETVFLKSDTQGFDLEVLRGAKGRLDACVGLQLEVAVTPLYAGMPDWRELVDFTAERGYVPSGFFVVNRAPDLRAIEFDFIAIRHDRV